MQAIVFKKANIGRFYFCSIGGDSFIIQLILRGLKNAANTIYFLCEKLYYNESRISKKITPSKGTTE